MYKHLIGSASDKVKNTVESGAIRRFALAIGDENPLYTDTDAGEKSAFRRNIAPVTFPVTLNYGTIEDLNLPSKGLIHGEQAFHYERPLYAGETILCSSKLSNCKERSGNGGSMVILTIERTGETEKGEVIFTMTQSVIMTEAARKGMTL
ncbi:MaoC family dehydratase N-terminal domain-containing protein [Bacillus sp. FSL H8-0547]